MERVACSLSPAHTALFTCTCQAPSLNLCIECLEDHLQSDLPHEVTRLPSSKHPSSSSICSVCQLNRSTDLCTCRVPVPLLCPMCRILHMSKEITPLHRFLPINLKEEIQSEQDLLIVRHRLAILDQAEGKLRRNIVEIATCEEKLEVRGRVVVDAIQQFKANLLKQIQEKRKSLEMKKEAVWKTGEIEAQVVKIDPWFSPDCDRLLGLKWESRWSASDPLKADFTLLHKDLKVLRTPPVAESSLCGSVDEYLAAVTREVSEGNPSISETDLQTCIAEAKLRYYKEHYFGADAMEKAVSESDQTTTQFHSYIHSRVSPVISTLYQSRLNTILTVQTEKKLELETARQQLAKMNEKHRHRGRKGRRARSRSARNGAGSSRETRGITDTPDFPDDFGEQESSDPQSQTASPSLSMSQPADSDVSGSGNRK